MRADLHTHSSVSDGTEPPAIVIRRAAEAGLDVIALTDHDTVAGQREAASALPEGLTLVPGAELSCRLEGHSVHMLAYLFDPENDQLAGEMAEIRESRLHRARAMVRKLNDLGAPVNWEQVSEIAGGGVVGRPHIARAMVEAGRHLAVRRGVHPGVDRPGRSRARLPVCARPGQGHPPGSRGWRGHGPRPPARSDARLADP